MSSRISTPASARASRRRSSSSTCSACGGAVLEILLELREALLALLEPFAALGLQLLVRIDLVLSALQLGAQLVDLGSGQIDLRDARVARLEIRLERLQRDLAHVQLACASGDCVGAGRVGLQARLGGEDLRLATHDSGLTRLELGEQGERILGGLAVALPLPVEPLLLRAEALLPGAHRDLGVRRRDGELASVLRSSSDSTCVEKLRPLGESRLGGRRASLRGRRSGRARRRSAPRARARPARAARARRRVRVRRARVPRPAPRPPAGRSLERDALALQLALALADRRELLCDLSGCPRALALGLLELLDAAVDVRAELRHARILGDDLRVPLDELRALALEVLDAFGQRLLALRELGRALLEVDLVL